MRFGRAVPSVPPRVLLAFLFLPLVLSVAGCRFAFLVFPLPVGRRLAVCPLLPFAF